MTFQELQQKWWALLALISVTAWLLKQWFIDNFGFYKGDMTDGFIGWTVSELPERSSSRSEAQPTEHKPLTRDSYCNNYEDLFEAKDVRSALEGFTAELDSVDVMLIKKWFPVFYEQENEGSE